MIDIKHPDPIYRKNQENGLSDFPLEKRRYWELMFSHTNACLRYYQLTDEIKPTEQDYQEWLEGLPKNIREVETDAGFDKAKKSLPFLRYVLEKADIGLDAYVRELMGEKLYAEYKATVLADPPEASGLAQGA